jgi:hypothetical protein
MTWGRPSSLKSDRIKCPRTIGKSEINSGCIASYTSSSQISLLSSISFVITKVSLSKSIQHAIRSLSIHVNILSSSKNDRKT